MERRNISSPAFSSPASPLRSPGFFLFPPPHIRHHSAVWQDFSDSSATKVFDSRYVAPSKSNFAEVGFDAKNQHPKIREIRIIRGHSTDHPMRPTSEFGLSRPQVITCGNHRPWQFSRPWRFIPNSEVGGIVRWNPTADYSDSPDFFR